MNRQPNKQRIKPPQKRVTRANIDKLRGKYRGKGLLKALMAEKKRER